MDKNGNAGNGGNKNSIEDELQNLWQFVFIEARKAALLAYKVERIEQTLPKDLAEIRQRLEKTEEKDKN